MKAIEILKEGLDFMNQAIKVNPNSVKELQSEIDRYVEAIDELEELNNRSCEGCSADYIKCKIFIAYWKKTESSCIDDSKCFYCNKWEPK